MLRLHPQWTAPRHTNENHKLCIFHFDETIPQGLFMSKPHYTVLSYLTLFGKQMERAGSHVIFTETFRSSFSANMPGIFIAKQCGPKFFHIFTGLFRSPVTPFFHAANTTQNNEKFGIFAEPKMKYSPLFIKLFQRAYNWITNTANNCFQFGKYT